MYPKYIAIYECKCGWKGPNAATDLLMGLPECPECNDYLPDWLESDWMRFEPGDVLLVDEECV